MKRIRLDKLLSGSGYGSRKDVKGIIKARRVVLDEEVITDSSYNVDITSQKVSVDGNQIAYKEFYYLMMNKPADVISATKDNVSRTVIDLLPPEFTHLDLFPVGRLDKDTEGLLILTNDGQLAHQLLSPKKHVPKTYYAEIEGSVSEDDIKTFKAGIELGDDFTTLPADLTIITSGSISTIYVTIYEGKFHQVKRMFEAVNKKVIFLKRESMGGLKLDEALHQGDVRELTFIEMSQLRSSLI